ncbi:hypothetical protein D3C85_1318790 [compost metagenome]
MPAAGVVGGATCEGATAAMPVPTQFVASGALSVEGIVLSVVASYRMAMASLPLPVLHARLPKAPAMVASVKPPSHPRTAGPA